VLQLRPKQKLEIHPLQRPHKTRLSTVQPGPGLSQTGTPASRQRNRFILLAELRATKNSHQFGCLQAPKTRSKGRLNGDGYMGRHSEPGISGSIAVFCLQKICRQVFQNKNTEESLITPLYTQHDWS